MKCFDGTERGFKLTLDDKFGWVLRLGGSAYGACRIQIKLAKDNPPDMLVRGELQEANFRSFLFDHEKWVQKYLEFIPPRYGDDRAMVRVSTRGRFPHLLPGTIVEMASRVSVVAMGWGTKTYEGHLRIWQDALVIMNPGDWVWVRPSGAKLPKNWYYLFYDGDSVRLLFQEEWKALPHKSK